MQDSMDAQRQDQQEEQEQEQDQQEEEEPTKSEGIENGTVEEEPPSGSSQESGEDQPAEGSNERVQPTSSQFKSDDDDRKPPPRSNGRLDPSRQRILPKPNGTAAAATSPSPWGAVPNKENPAFPAFHLVTRPGGASVYRHEEEDSQKTCFLVLRVVPAGVVFLGTKMEYRKCVLTNKMMIRMPDGWVNEDDVERIAAVPFEPSQSQ
jgi:hypothetical protein